LFSILLIATVEPSIGVGREKGESCSEKQQQDDETKRPLSPPPFYPQLFLSGNCLSCILFDSESRRLNNAAGSTRWWKSGKVGVEIGGRSNK